MQVVRCLHIKLRLPQMLPFWDLLLELIDLDRSLYANVVIWAIRFFYILYSYRLIGCR